MYGTVAIIKPKAGSEQAVVAHFDKWWNERRPKVKGAIASTLHRNEQNPSELILSVVMDSKANYEANANDPDQDKWYQQMRALLDADPRWMDGDVLACRHV
jgi:quinol monooxygenase YgiN